jgi:hypothetical protein
MRYVGKSKVSKLNPKPNLIYSLLRLPQEYEDIIGKIAHIYEYVEEGQKSILLVFDESENKRIIKPVVKQSAESSFSTRILLLEKEISDLKALMEKGDYFSNNTQKNQWDRPDSNRRPPPFEGSFSKLESVLSFFLERSTIFAKKAIPSS